MSAKSDPKNRKSLYKKINNFKRHKKLSKAMSMVGAGGYMLLSLAPMGKISSLEIPFFNNTPGNNKTYKICLTDKMPSMDLTKSSADKNLAFVNCLTNCNCVKVACQCSSYTQHCGWYENIYQKGMWNMCSDMRQCHCTVNCHCDYNCNCVTNCQQPNL